MLAFGWTISRLRAIGEFHQQRVAVYDNERTIPVWRGRRLAFAGE